MRVLRSSREQIVGTRNLLKTAMPIFREALARDKEGRESLILFRWKWSLHDFH